MSITNDEQVRLWKPSAGTADSYAGDGTPVHSLLLHDMVRGVNTMVARCEPQMSFAMDASYGLLMQGSASAKGATLWKMTGTVPASGMAFLAQMPIEIPQGATALNVAIGIGRFGGGIDPAIHVNVTKINMFLSDTPLNTLDTSGTFPPSSQELVGNFSATTVLNAKYARQHDITVSFTGGTTYKYGTAVDTTWTDHNTNGFDWPCAFLIVGVTYDSAIANEQIFLREFSMWGTFDKSANGLVQFDDAKRVACRNGAGTTGRVVKDLLGALITNASRPRPIFNMWGGSDAINATGLYRQNWLDVSPASPGIQARFLTVPSTGVPDANQSVEFAIGALVTQDSKDPPVQYDATNPLRYPSNARLSPTAVVMQVKELISAVPTKGKPYELLMGSNTANGPQIRSMCVYEDICLVPEHLPLDAPQAPYDDWSEHGSQIIGTELNDFRLRSMRAVRDYFRRVFKARRVHFGWTGINGTAPYTGYITFSGAVTQYIFDNSIGSGATAPTVTGPGIVIPLYRSASGLNTRVRCYVSVYARQTGGGSGLMEYYNRNDDGTTMSTALPLFNFTAITSSTWQWYGFSATFNEATDWYCKLNATLPYDRLVLCGRTNGTGELDIGAFTIACYYSEQ